MLPKLSIINSSELILTFIEKYEKQFHRCSFLSSAANRLVEISQLHVFVMSYFSLIKYRYHFIEHENMIDSFIMPP